MNIFSENNLTKWIVILPIISIIMTALVLGLTGMQKRKSQLEKDTRIEQIRLIKQQKVDAQRRVKNIASYIKSTENILKDEARVSVNNTVTFAYNIINNIYKNNQNLPKKQILEKIKERLRDIRFWDGTGYFFIHSFDGVCILLPPQPKLENKRSLNWKDATGTFIIQKAIKISKEEGESFIDWWWYKPNEKVMKKKIGFIKAFKPLDIYVGTARYEEDILLDIKNSMKKRFLKNFLEDNKKYFFIYDLDGNPITRNGAQKNKEDILTIIKGSKYSPEGFFLNYNNTADYVIEKELLSDSSFVRYMPKFGWILGANIFRDEILRDMALKKKEMEDDFANIIKSRTIFSFMIVGFMMLVAGAFSAKLKSVFKSYQRSLIEKNRETLTQKELLEFNLKHDYLTSLPNRFLLTDRIEQIIRHSRRDKKKFAIMFIDLDKFKIINDTLGHDAGDELLKEVSLRLKSVMRRSDTVARFGGDEFVVLIDEFKNLHDIITILDKIQKIFLEKVTIKNSSHKVTLSMGISVFPHDGDDIQTLLRHADIAMYKAKEEGGDNYRFFTADMNEEIQKQVEIEQDLNDAVKNREFVLHYQPLVETRTGHIVGVEALLRWNHPTRGLIFPDEFISIAEESSIIIELGRWITEEAMRQMSEWKKKGYKLKKMSINIATKQLENEDFIDCIKSKLKKTACKAEWVEVEIVERFAMKNIEKSIQILHELRKLNIDIAIDDFGTGHSSLAYLRKLPITKLKIDRAFVKNILYSYEDKAIAESILALGSGLRLKVLAEGVEREEEREFFAYNGCDEIQGYLFSKPLPVNEIEKLLEKGRF